MNLLTWIKKSGFLLMIAFSLPTLESCLHYHCEKRPRDYVTLSFRLIDQNTNKPFLLMPNATALVPAPDSIRLKNITTGTNYVLMLSVGTNKEVSFLVQDYKGKKGTVDLLEFRIGQARPDTITITVGTIDGWRGDECGFVDDPGITEVKQNGVTVYTYQKYADSTFVLKK